MKRAARKRKVSPLSCVNQWSAIYLAWWSIVLGCVTSVILQIIWLRLQLMNLTVRI